jgi:S1-C subfamily serine protease
MSEHDHTQHFDEPAAGPADAADRAAQPLAAEAAAAAEAAPGRPTSFPGRRRTIGLAAAAVAGALVVGGVGAGAGVAWESGRVDQTATASAGTGTALPFGGIQVEPGVGVSPFGGSLGSTQNSASADQSPATAQQLTGLVRVVSTVDYGAGKAIGTGIVLGPNGEVVTNHHVVAQATSIRVRVMSTGRTYTATVVGTDAKADVAVLQLNGASGLTTAPIAQHRVKVGAAVTAVGDAEGLQRLSAASGKVTGVGQAITTSSDATTPGERLKGLIEMNADVISGDSGGATLNANGRVVGMTTAASSGTADVRGYAIPIAKVVRIADTIENGTQAEQIQYGYPAFLGVELRGRSTRVAGTVRDSAAADAGIVPGDTVTAVDGSSVSTGTQLRAAVADHAPGDRVTLTWTDASGTTHTASVTLGRGPVA